MKHLFVFILLLVALTSCKDQPRDSNGYFYEISKIEYEGHSYLLYRSSSGRVNGITHNMNCSCVKNQ